MKFHSVLLILFALLLTSCGGDWYLDGAPKQATYTEEPKIGNLAAGLTKSSGQEIYIKEEPELFETKGQGLNIGLIYQSDLVHQKFSYYQNDFDEVTYNFSINGSPYQQTKIKYETQGYNYLLGMRIGNFIPRVAMRVEDQQVTTTAATVTEAKKTGQIFLGYGLEFKLPVTQSLDIFASWDRTLKVSKDPNFRIRNDEIAVGFNYSPFTKSSGSTSVRPNSSLLPYWKLY